MYSTSVPGNRFLTCNTVHRVGTLIVDDEWGCLHGYMLALFLRPTCLTLSILLSVAEDVLCGSIQPICQGSPLTTKRAKYTNRRSSSSRRQLVTFEFEITSSFSNYIHLLYVHPRTELLTYTRFTSNSREQNLLVLLHLTLHHLTLAVMYTRHPPKQLQSKSAGPNTRCQVSEITCIRGHRTSTTFLPAEYKSSCMIQ